MIFFLTIYCVIHRVMISNSSCNLSPTCHMTTARPHNLLLRGRKALIRALAHTFQKPTCEWKLLVCYYLNTSGWFSFLFQKVMKWGMGLWRWQTVEFLMVVSCFDWIPKRRLIQWDVVCNCYFCTFSDWVIYIWGWIISMRLPSPSSLCWFVHSIVDWDNVN